MERAKKGEWIHEINKNNDVEHESKGLGSICNLHFLPTDIQKVKGRLRSKADAVPMVFPIPNIACSDEALENIAEAETLNACINCNDLNLELKELKQMLLQIQIDANIQTQMKNEQIEKLKTKCNDLTLKNDGLKEKHISLEKMLKNHESQIKLLREKSLLNVNFEFDSFLKFEFDRRHIKIATFLFLYHFRTIT